MYDYLSINPKGHLLNLSLTSAQRIKVEVNIYHIPDKKSVSALLLKLIIGLTVPLNNSEGVHKMLVREYY